jgi:hypothetical protein
MVPDEENPGANDAGQSSPGTPRAPTGKRMALNEEARRHEQDALQVLVSISKDETQPNSLRLRAAAELLNRSRGRPPVAKHASLEAGPSTLEVRWLPPDPNDHSQRIPPEPD